MISGSPLKLFRGYEETTSNRPLRERETKQILIIEEVFVANIFERLVILVNLKYWKQESDFSLRKEIGDDSLTEKPEISILRNWRRQKKLYRLPAFLLPKEQKEALLRSKKHVRGKPKKSLD